MGSSMIRPEGSAIRPRMPDICEICWMLPLAPDWAIIATGPNGSSTPATALVTWSLALVQTSMTSL